MSEMIWAPCEQAVRKVRSVISTSIKGNAANEIVEIHILANSDRNPKQIVRDVESMLAAQFGIEIDHKIISVVQLEQQEGETEVSRPPLKGTQLRPRLASVSLRTVNTKAEIKVELSIDEKIYEGVASGTSTTYTKLRLLADATINALHTSLMNKLVFATEDVVISHLGKHKVALVELSLITPIGEQSLVGCALIKNDEREAVVKATLDAVNRKLWFF
ncbi:hypothetical protein Desdi_0479 [Desulfitobacterium dichloroeliminans LMG P-21439]|uniref:Uncharacterized protein n=1 Tax=Desulfitobacterium dichloroeliminans (strain LMG P-21439 / DCA1) TaxID=871963 RepID=L0F4E0_DESDL|nr:hypothetical protein [Desulfitobacterium dichloroeliminans]AGA68022.1 hypothetical protein Desdi_0479 [Desulfitobacterium dichloroeliminans LMG P-21439]